MPLPTQYICAVHISNAINIIQAYGRDLAEANEWCKKYMATNNVKDLTQAWELYYHVFRRISKQLPQASGYEWEPTFNPVLRGFM